MALKNQVFELAWFGTKMTPHFSTVCIFLWLQNTWLEADCKETAEHEIQKRRKEAKKKFEIDSAATGRSGY